MELWSRIEWLRDYGKYWVNGFGTRGSNEAWGRAWIMEAEPQLAGFDWRRRGGFYQKRDLEYLLWILLSGTEEAEVKPGGSIEKLEADSVDGFSRIGMDGYLGKPS